MNEAIQVNPYHPSEVADALKEAFEIPRAEQEMRFDQMKKKLRMMDVHWWKDRFFDEWELSIHSSRSFEATGEEEPGT